MMFAEESSGDTSSAVAEKRCTRFLVSGRVQGVFFRASTQEKAAQLGITGWARNLADGRVEVIAHGSENALENLHAWLWDGPRHAEVTSVSTEPVQCEVPETFSIG